MLRKSMPPDSCCHTGLNWLCGVGTLVGAGLTGEGMGGYNVGVIKEWEKTK